MANADKKKTLKKVLGEAGALLANDTNYDGLYQVLKSLANGHKNKRCSGLDLAAPTTASTQASGVGNTAWRVNVAAGTVAVGGKKKEHAAQADLVIHSGSFLAGFVNGDSCVAAIVEKKDAAGVMTTIAVKGTPAVTGAQKSPTDAQIQAVVGAGLEWTKLGETTLNRTADTAVTQSVDNTAGDFGDLVTVE